MTLIDEQTLRRRMSVDIAIQDRLPRTDAGDVLAPLFLLEKGRAQSTQFDFEDETGRSITLPTRADNGLVSTGVLHAAAIDLLGSREAVGQQLWEQLETVAQADPIEAEDLLEQLGLCTGGRPATPAIARLQGDADFRWLAEVLATSSVLLVPLRATSGDRKLVKLSFDQQIDDLSRGRQRGLVRAGWRGYRFVVDMPFVGAGTYHFEIHVPRGVELTRTRIFTASREEVGSAVLHGPRQNMHMYVPNACRQRTGLAELNLRLGRTGFATGAVVASAIVVTVLALFIAFAGSIADGSSSTAPALLLALPGGIATYVLGVQEGTITSRLLTWARGFLLVSGLAAFGAALRLALDQPTEDHPVTACALRAWWIPLGVLALLAFLCLLITRFAPRVPSASGDEA